MCKYNDRSQDTILMCNVNVFFGISVANDFNNVPVHFERYFNLQPHVIIVKRKKQNQTIYLHKNLRIDFLHTHKTWFNI